MDHASEPLALAQPLALGDDELVAVETTTGEVDGQPDESAEEEEQEDVVPGRPGRRPHLDDVGDGDDACHDQPARATVEHRGADDAAGRPDRRERELSGRHVLGPVGEQGREDAGDRQDHLDGEQAGGAAPEREQQEAEAHEHGDDGEPHPGPRHRLVAGPEERTGIQGCRRAEVVEPARERLDDDRLRTAGAGRRAGDPEQRPPTVHRVTRHVARRHPGSRRRCRRRRARARARRRRARAPRPRPAHAGGCAWRG